VRDRQTHRRPWPIYISPRLRLTRNAMKSVVVWVVTGHENGTIMVTYDFLLAFNINDMSLSCVVFEI